MNGLRGSAGVKVCQAAAVVLALGLLVGCGRPSVGVGYGIPGTPVSVGASVPVGPPESASKGFKHLPLRVESVPEQAEVYIGNQLVGSTPVDVMVPFQKGTFGGAKGSTLMLLKKPGYAPEGIALFPASGGLVSRSADGAGMRTLRVELRRAK